MRSAIMTFSLFPLLAALTAILVTTPLFADSLDGRLGITGRTGAFIPLKNDFINGTNESRTSLAAGGGLILGFCKNWAVEMDALHAFSMDIETSGTKVFESTLTDVSLGLQYRFASGNRLVPFLGAGADFLKGTLKSVTGNGYDLDWTEGGHLNAGVDWFLDDGIALTAEIRGMMAAKGDIKNAGGKVGDYYPRSLAATFGLRLVLPKSSYW